MTREQAINYLISSGFNQNQVSEIVRALTYEPTTKNDLGVGAVSRQSVLELVADYDLSMGQVVRGIHALPSVTPQEPRKGYLSIDDVMSVFDDFMCGEVDEDGTATFLEMLKDKADMREVKE